MEFPKIKKGWRIAIYVTFISYHIYSQSLQDLSGLVFSLSNNQIDSFFTSNGFLFQDAGIDSINKRNFICYLKYDPQLGERRELYVFIYKNIFPSYSTYEINYCSNYEEEYDRLKSVCNTENGYRFIKDTIESKGIMQSYCNGFYTYQFRKRRIDNEISYSVYIYESGDCLILELNDPPEIPKGTNVFP